ncbi:hypothetical protein SNEBB_009366 [Seison nebaliae]|nr:hypothetical protein SNEBB_009366 [Seison nebaliae]
MANMKVEKTNGQMEKSNSNENFQVKVVGSRCMKFKNKVCYIDLKENNVDRFFKIVGIFQSRRQQIFLSIETALQLCKILETFEEFDSKIEFTDESKEKSGSGTMNNDPVKLLKTQDISMHGRKYYVDLKENARGRFLRICSVNRYGLRNSVTIPSDHISELRKHLTELYEEHGVGFEKSADAMNPETFHTANKGFVMEPKVNNRGAYLILSEYTKKYEMFVQLPRESWATIRDKLSSLIEKFNEMDAIDQVVKVPKPEVVDPIDEDNDE